MSNSPEQDLKETPQIQRRPRAARRARLTSACLLALCACVSFNAVARQQPAPARTHATAAGSGASTTRPARAAQTTTVTASRKPARPAPPVIAVVHRLRGWKLRALVTPPDAPFASAFDDSFVRMTVVAGYVMPDGRTVVARLPREEAEMLNHTALFPDFYESATKREGAGLLVMKQDGAQVPVKFVGFDGGTGLSLLEAAEPVHPQQPERDSAPAVGQRVRLIAPLRAEVVKAVAASAPPTVVTKATPAPEGSDAPIGVTGVLYMSLGEVEGRLKEVRRAPAGGAVGLTLEAGRASSPEWAGGVALDEAGSLVGIAEQSAGRETRLVSARAVRAAAERVRARRASVPQPWLGVRGDAVAGAQLNFFTERGWPRQQASELLRRQQGVMLTAVAPGTPAARAGLRAGDVVSRIDDFEVRGVEDMTWILKEAGGNRRAEFTILRAHEPPKSLTVQLSESQNPALEMARAEERALRAETEAARAQVRRLDEEVRQADTEIATLDEALRKSPDDSRAASQETLARRREAVERITKLQRRVRELHPDLISAEMEYVRSRQRLEEATARLHAAGGAGAATAFRPLLPFGVKAMLYMASMTVAGREVPDRGLVVLEVNADGPAERGGLKNGDVIELVDGQAPHYLDLSDKPPAELGGETTLAVRRNGRRFTVKLTRPVR